LCGINIKSPFGFKAHSDGDVAIHAIMMHYLGLVGIGRYWENFFQDGGQIYY